MFIKQLEIARQITISTNKVTIWADYLNDKIGEDGYYDRSFSKETPKDFWGKELQASYYRDDNGFYEQIKVQSFGPDGTSNTNDDIIVYRQLMSRLSYELIKDVEDLTKSGTQDLADGLMEGLEADKSSPKKSTKP